MSKLKRYFSFIFVVAISLFILTSCDNQELSNRIETTINNMLPNIYVTLAQLAVFILTALIFIKFAYKPIKKILNQRSEYIENNIKQAEIKNQEAQQKVEKANSLILSSEQKAAEIIQQAQITAENKTSQIEQELAKQIEQEKIQAHKDIQQAHKKMLKQAQQEILQTAISTSKNILQREIKQEDNDKFVEQFIDELSKDNTKDK